MVQRDFSVKDPSKMNGELCFCCKKGVNGEDVLFCNICEGAVHRTCLNVTPMPLPGDKFWDVICSDCGDPTGRCNFKIFSCRRNISSWNDVVELVLSCLANQPGNEEETFFHLDGHMIPFIDDYYDQLHLPKKFGNVVKEYRRLFMQNALNRSSNLFANGGIANRHKTLWTLRKYLIADEENYDDSPPELQPIDTTSPESLESLDDESQSQSPPQVSMPYSSNIMTSNDRIVLTIKLANQVSSQLESTGIPSPDSDSINLQNCHSNHDSLSSEDESNYFSDDPDVIISNTFEKMRVRDKPHEMPNGTCNGTDGISELDIPAAAALTEDNVKEFTARQNAISNGFETYLSGANENLAQPNSPLISEVAQPQKRGRGRPRKTHALEINPVDSVIHGVKPKDSQPVPEIEIDTQKVYMKSFDYPTVVNRPIIPIRRTLRRKKKRLQFSSAEMIRKKALLGINNIRRGRGRPRKQVCRKSIANLSNVSRRLTSTPIVPNYANMYTVKYLAGSTHPSELLKLQDEVAQIFRSEMNPTAANPKENSPKPWEKSKRDLNDRSSYDVVGKWKDENGRVRYYCEWKDGYGNNCVSKKDEEVYYLTEEDEIAHLWEQTESLRNCPKEEDSQSDASTNSCYELIDLTNSP